MRAVINSGRDFNQDASLPLLPAGAPALGAGLGNNSAFTVAVLPHEFFIRDGDDILYELPINFAQAALGTEVEVPTLDGKTRIKVPAGSQTGKVLRLKGQGIPHLRRSGHGDQLVTIFVVTPESLTKHQRQLLEELASSLGPANMPSQAKWEGLLDRLRNAFGA